MVRNTLLKKGDIIKKGFDCKVAVEKYVAYLHGFHQLPVNPSYTGDRITLCTFLQIIPIYNKTMLGLEQLVVDFLWIHFNTKKAL